MWARELTKIQLYTFKLIPSTRHTSPRHVCLPVLSAKRTLSSSHNYKYHLWVLLLHCRRPPARYRCAIYAGSPIRDVLMACAPGSTVCFLFRYEAINTNSSCSMVLFSCRTVMASQLSIERKTRMTTLYSVCDDHCPCSVSRLGWCTSLLMVLSAAQFSSISVTLLYLLLPGAFPLLSLLGRLAHCVMVPSAARRRPPRKRYTIGTELLSAAAAAVVALKAGSPHYSAEGNVCLLNFRTRGGRGLNPDTSFRIGSQPSEVVPNGGAGRKSRNVYF